MRERSRMGEAAVAIFPYPRKAEMTGNEHSLGETFARQLDEFNQRFEQRPGCYKLLFGHFGVAGARVSSGQPLVGRCAEYPLDPLRSLKAQYAGSATFTSGSSALRAFGMPGRSPGVITAKSKTRATTW